jgi:4-diphosphocytidyl-2-C-methyl-D-erythritol kinase
MPTTVRISAPAKVNLSLEVTGRRPDGYYDIVSLMQTVSLADTLTLWPAERVTVTVHGAELPEENLVTRAADLLRRRYNVRAGCAVDLDKRIPIAAGLGGGSSDAASTIIGLRRLWGLDLDAAELRDVAAELGSDVPFFLCGGTALVEGRGELVTPLPSCHASWYLLVNPGFPVSTAAVYGALDRGEWTDGEATRALAAGCSGTTSTTPLGTNTLQTALFRVSPEARECLEAVAQVTPGRAMVSGSGPTVFATFEDGETSREACAALRSRGYWAEVARAIPAQGNAIVCA